MMRAMSLLVGGNVAGQLVTVLSTIVIARLYGSNDYGQLAIVMSLSAIIGSAAHGRFHLALGSSVDLRRAVGIVRLAFLTIVCINLLCALAFFASVQLSLFEISGETIAYTLLIAAGTSILEVSSYWRSYRGDHAYTARMTIARALLTPLTQATLFPFQGQGLVLGMTISIYMVVAMAIWREAAGGSPLISLSFCLRYLRNLAVHYRDFPLYSLPQGVLTSLAFNAVPIVIGVYETRSTVGQYWLAYRILLAPVAVFGNAYRQIFLTQSSKVSSKESPYAIDVKKHTVYSAIVTLPAAAIFLFIAPAIFEFAYGEQWRLAGEFAAWFGIITATTLTKVPSVSKLQSLRKLGFLLQYEIASSIGKLLLLWIMIQHYTVVVTIAVYSIVSAIINICIIPAAVRGDTRVKAIM